MSTLLKETVSCFCESQGVTVNHSHLQQLHIPWQISHHKLPVPSVHGALHVVKSPASHPKAGTSCGLRWQGYCGLKREMWSPLLPVKGKEMRQRERNLTARGVNARGGLWKWGLEPGPLAPGPCPLDVCSMHSSKPSQVDSAMTQVATWPIINIRRDSFHT